MIDGTQVRLERASPGAPRLSGNWHLLSAVLFGVLITALVWAFALALSNKPPENIPNGLFVKRGPGTRPVIPFVRDYKYGYLDCQGRVALETEYYWADEFVDGHALCRIEESFVVIDETGTIVGRIPTIAEFAFRAGPDRIWLKEGEKWGLCNLRGEIVVEPTYHDVGRFSDDLAWVSLGGRRDYTGQWVGDLVGYIDGDGRVIIDITHYRPAFSFHDDFAVVGYWLINRLGERQFRRENIGRKLSDGLVPVFRDDHTEYLDSEGRTVFKVSGVGSEFSEGLATLSIGGLVGFIDTTGKWAIDPQFLDAKPFTNGLAAVSTSKDKWGFIDHAGRLVTPTHFNDVKSAFGRFLVVHYGGERVTSLHEPSSWRLGRWIMTDRVGSPLAVLHEDFSPRWVMRYD